MTNATMNELKNAIATTDTETSAKTAKTSRAKTSRAKTNAITTEIANRKIENNEQLTEAEVKSLQESAVTRYASFSDSFKALANKHDSIEYIKDSNRDAYFKIDSLTSHISRKEHKIVLYTTSCRDVEERNAVLARFKNTKSVHACDNKHYLDSKETRCEIIFTDVNTIQCEESFINSLIKTVRECQKIRADLRKSEKKAKIAK